MEIEKGLCHCGCGGKTDIIIRNNARDGDVKGQHRRFISGHQRRAPLRIPEWDDQKQCYRLALSGSQGEGKFVLFDEEDLPLVKQYRWTGMSNGWGTYAKACAPGKRTILMHRMILGITSPNVYADHINHDTLDNRRSNLRIATPSQNAYNSRASSNGKSSRFKGVTWVRRRGRWQAYICISGKHRHLGYFWNEVDAARAYDAAAQEFFGEFALTNEDMISRYDPAH